MLSYVFNAGQYLISFTLDKVKKPARADGFGICLSPIRPPPACNNKHPYSYMFSFKLCQVYATWAAFRDYSNHGYADRLIYGEQPKGQPRFLTFR